jgi:hypothetical protein
VRQRGLDRLGQRRIQLDPKRPPGLGGGRPKPDAAARLVVVTDLGQVDRGNAGTGPVEKEQRQPMLGRDAAVDGLDVGGGLRLDFLRFLAR